ncbi:MAG TPA: protein translocase subunit SecF [Candidatus Limnocylindria bacterium]|nr:protein translocase subunit SecF [Candidatus Limnocylindria bacterium]
MLFRFVERKYWYFLLSALLIVPGTFFLAIGGLKLGIEFKGGTLLDLRFQSAPPAAEIRDLFTSLGHQEAVVQGAEGGRVEVRTVTLSAEETTKADQTLKAKYPTSFIDDNAASVSPSFSAELVTNAVRSIAAASVLIVLLIAFAFKEFGWSAFRYGFAAIVALLHDALVVLGLFAILGFFFNIEVDSLFVTAVLTIIGFSVHDTIVVFDRIRENLRLNRGEALNPVINFSIMQTLARSVITSLTVVLTLLALYLFGGYSMRTFALALIVGIISGTYSSIFNASQIISLWQEIEDRIRHRSAGTPSPRPAAAG